MICCSCELSHRLCFPFIVQLFLSLAEFTGESKFVWTVQATRTGILGRELCRARMDEAKKQVQLRYTWLNLDNMRVMCSTSRPYWSSGISYSYFLGVGVYLPASGWRATQAGSEWRSSNFFTFIWWTQSWYMARCISLVCWSGAAAAFCRCTWHDWYGSSAKALKGVMKKAEAKIARANKLTIDILILPRETWFLFMIVSFSLKRSLLLDTSNRYAS